MKTWAAGRTTIKIADLFCGAGGTSSGAVDAIKILGRKAELTAINHWPTAIATHTENHPDARHLTTSIDNVNPRTLYSEGELDVLWASPECTHHSVARGGRPINDQSRATAWCVVRWAGDLRPDIILVENVPEFITWGGIGTNGRPLKNQKGKTYLAWKSALESLGYRVDQKVLCAADYGDPTTRRRLFVMAVRGRRKIVWPEPTHSDPKFLNGSNTDFAFEKKRKPWVAAREIIDWKIEGQSIYERKRPLSDKTMRRIMAGLRKFGLRPFIVPQTNGTRDVERPAPTVTTTSRGVGVVEPMLAQRALVESFIVGVGGPEYSAKPKSVDEPLNTVIAQDRRGLVEPYLVNMKGASNASDIEKPAPTVTAHASHLHLAEPLLINLKGGEDSHVESSAQDLGKPSPTVCANGNHIGIAEFLIPQFGERDGQEPRCHSVDEPLPAVTGHGAGALVTSKLEGFVVGIDHHGGNGDQLRSASDPLSTISTKARHCVAEPYLVQVAHGNGKERQGDIRRSRSLNEPMPTVCGNRGDMALCEPSLLPQHSGGVLRPVSEPMPTVATDGAIGLIDACLVKFYGTATDQAQSVDAPLDTVTSKDRHALVRWAVRIKGETYLLDIRFRMLQPHELAAAQGFRKSYKFTGNKSEQVKQIGNAVPRRLARALVLSALTQQSDVAQFLEQEMAA